MVLGHRLKRSCLLFIHAVGPHDIEPQAVDSDDSESESATSGCHAVTSMPVQGAHRSLKGALILSLKLLRPASLGRATYSVFHGLAWQSECHGAAKLGFPPGPRPGPPAPLATVTVAQAAAAGAGRMAIAVAAASSPSTGELQPA